MPPSSKSHAFGSTGCGRPYGRDAVWMALFDRIADGIVAALRARTDAGRQAIANFCRHADRVLFHPAPTRRTSGT